jgi:hypothetical protein
MSDERIVEARILSLLTLSLTSDLVDPGSDFTYGTDAVVIPEYIATALQDTAECSRSPELRRLAQLGLAISNGVRLPLSLDNRWILNPPDAIGHFLLRFPCTGNFHQCL